MSEWSLKSTKAEVFDALALWLAEHERSTYSLTYDEGIWAASFLTQENGTQTYVGSSPHEATIDLFVGFDVPHPSTRAPERTSIFDRNLNPAGPDRFA